MKMKMMVDRDGQRIIKFVGEDSERYLDYLGNPISDDLRRSEWCDIVLKRIQVIEKTESMIELWEGNSFQIDTDGEHVKVAYQTDIDLNSVFPLSDFKAAVTAWKRFVDANPGPDDTAEIGL